MTRGGRKKKEGAWRRRDLESEEEVTAGGWMRIMVGFLGNIC